MSEALQAAMVKHQSGRLEEAEAIYRNMLQREPGHAFVLHLLALLCYQRGRPAEGIPLITRAIALDERVPQFHVNHGNLLKQSGDVEAAIGAYRRALALDPVSADAHNNLGDALLRQRDFAAAERCFRDAVRAGGRQAPFLSNLAVALQEQGRLAEALESLRAVVAAYPRHAEGWYNLGNVHRHLGQAEAALDAYRQATELNPGLVEAWYNLGNEWCLAGNLGEAARCYQHVLSLSADHVPAIYNLGNVLLSGGCLDEAIACYAQVLLLKPDHAGAYYSFGNALQGQGKPSEAAQQYDRALSLDPNLVKAYHMKSGALYDQGRVEEAIRLSELAVQQRGEMSKTFSNALLMANYLEGIGPEILLERHREFEARYGGHTWLPHANDSSPDRRLRVGYVSADFRRHSVAYFIEPVLSGHDRERIEVYGYYNHAVGDEVTERLRRHTDRWLDCSKLSNEALADRIRSDRIDILVDLSGHTSESRVSMFALKPAPVQVTYLGYPSTTGLKAVDYRLTDWAVDPAGYEAYNAEEPVRLPHSYYCYRPMDGSPEVGEPPVQRAGQITFGSFNNITKASPAILELWVQVLHGVPGSRLLLKARALEDPAVRSSILARLERLGLDTLRVQFHGWEAQAGTHLSLYAGVDVALDTFPYNGGTTTCEALWMGVPVVTLCGRTHASRMGASILKAAGLPDLVADTPEEYVRLAVQLGMDRERLAVLRATMRARLRASPLLDEAGFVRDLERAYRHMWHRWCRPAGAVAAEAAVDRGR